MREEVLRLCNNKQRKSENIAFAFQMFQYVTQSAAAAALRDHLDGS
jgi:hypothetical protein